MLHPNGQLSNVKIDQTWFAGLDEDANYYTVLGVDFVTSSGLITENFGAIMFGSEYPFLAGKEGYLLQNTSQFIELDLDDDWHRLGLAYDNGTGEMTGSLDGIVILTANYSPGEVTGILNVVMGSARFPAARIRPMWTGINWRLPSRLLLCRNLRRC